MNDTTLVFVHGTEIRKVEDLPHGSLALTVDTGQGKVAVLLDRGALSLVAQHVGRLRRQAAREGIRT